MNTKNKAVLGHLLALFVTIVWGSAFVSTKVLLRAFHPIEIIIFRFLIAWAVLFLCSPKPLLPKSWKSELPFIGAGLTGLTLYFMLENFALSYTFASNVGIIIAAAPMFTALLMWACRRTARPRWTFFAGFVIAIAGITLVSLSNGEAIGFGPLGDLLTLGAAFSWGAYGVLVEAVQPQGYTDLQATRKIFFWGLVFTIPFVFINHLDVSLARFAAPEMLFNILYLGLGSSALCFVFWNKATACIGTVATNVYIYLTPVVTVIASALFLGEPIRPAGLGAIALILLGLWLSQREPAGKA
jgi:drug/metabolite transporter (DMT)-like permease